MWLRMTTRLRCSPANSQHGERPFIAVVACFNRQEPLGPFVDNAGEMMGVCKTRRVWWGRMTTRLQYFSAAPEGGWTVQPFIGVVLCICRKKPLVQRAQQSIERSR